MKALILFLIVISTSLPFSARADGGNQGRGAGSGIRDGAVLKSHDQVVIEGRRRFEDIPAYVNLTKPAIDALKALAPDVADTLTQTKRKYLVAITAAALEKIANEYEAANKRTQIVTTYVCSQ